MRERSAADFGRRLRLTALVALTAFLPGCRESAPEGVALVGATVLDGSGRAPLQNAVVIVRGEHIAEITTRAAFRRSKNLDTVDVSGRWIIPGLIDAHVHVTRWSLTRYLAFGVTSVRDVHGTLDSIIRLRDQVNLNSIIGPRIWSAGAMIDGAPATYPDAFAASNEREARRAVDSLVQVHADFVKVYTRVTPTMLRAILDEAGTFQLQVTGHLGLTDALTAAALGISSIEHMSGVPEAAIATPEQLFAAHRRGFFAGWTAFERAWAGLDSATLARVAKGLVDRQVVLIPTLVLHDTYSRLDDASVYTDPALDAVPRAEIERWNTSGMIERARWTAADFAAFRRSRPKQDLFLRLFRLAGGIIAAGTDASNQQLVPGASLHREMELLVRAGLPPEEALLAATRNGAALLGADSVGTLAPGRVADLVVLSADPLSDIRNTQAIEYVMTRGSLLRADSLRRLR